MKKIILVFLLYFLCFDGEGYITDVTRFNPGIGVVNYQAFEINHKTIPEDVMLGCYKFESDSFILDELKREEIIAAQEE